MIKERENAESQGGQGQPSPVAIAAVNEKKEVCNQTPPCNFLIIYLSTILMHILYMSWTLHCRKVLKKEENWPS